MEISSDKQQGSIYYVIGHCDVPSVHLIFVSLFVTAKKGLRENYADSSVSFLYFSMCIDIANIMIFALHVAQTVIMKRAHNDFTSLRSPLCDMFDLGGKILQTACFFFCSFFFFFE